MGHGNSIFRLWADQQNVHSSNTPTDQGSSVGQDEEIHDVQSDGSGADQQNAHSSNTPIDQGSYVGQDEEIHDVQRDGSGTDQQNVHLSNTPTNQGSSVGPDEEIHGVQSDGSGADQQNTHSSNTPTDHGLSLEPEETPSVQSAARQQNAHSYSNERGVEYIASYDYEADVEERELGVLSFVKGETLTTLDTSFQWWLVRSSRDGREGYVPSNFLTPATKPLNEEEWYFGNMKRAEAERKLLGANVQRGTFIIRKASKPDAFAVSVRVCDLVAHYLIRRLENHTGFYIEERTPFATLAELVQHYLQNKGCLRAQLTHPYPKENRDQGNLTRRDQSSQTLQDDLTLGSTSGQPSTDQSDDPFTTIIIGPLPTQVPPRPTNTPSNTPNIHSVVRPTAAAECANADPDTGANLAAANSSTNVSRFSQTAAAPAQVDEKLEADFKTAYKELKGCLDKKVLKVRVMRDHLMDDVLKLYKGQDILQHKLCVDFTDETGQDDGGLTKELFTVFWAEASRQLFTGDHVVVPSLPLHRMKKESWKYVSLGRALSHTAALTETIPSVLARSTIIQLAFDSEVNEECLLEDFLLFVTALEKSLLIKALCSFSDEKGRLQDFYIANGYYDIPRASDIKDQITIIAHQELVTKPRELVSLMRRGLPPAHMGTFWQQLSVSHVTYLLSKQRPTPERVVSVMKTEFKDMTSEQERALYYLKEFVLAMDHDTLLDFLIMLTASIHQPTEITVGFSKLTGLQRRPVMHTCSNFLELPTTYHSFKEFQREFRHILSDPEARKYTIA